MLTNYEDDLYDHLSSEGLIVNIPCPAHVANTNYQYVDEKPDERVIGRGGVHCFTNVMR